MRLFTTTAGLALVLLAGAPSTAQDLYLTGGTIIDPRAREVTRANLLILDGRIAGRPAAAPAGFTGRVLDVSGRWLIPGLNDLHTHSYGNMGPGGVVDSPGTAIIARRMLYAGQTGFLDLFGNEDGLYALRGQQRAGKAGGAALFASLSCLTATEGHCTEYGLRTRVMDNPEDARREVGDLLTRLPDVVKIVYAPTGRMPSIDKATLAAAVTTARAHRIKTVIHVNTWSDVRDAIDVGASAVTHVPREPIPDGLAAAMAGAGVASIPTLAVHLDFAHLVGPGSPLESPLARAVAPAALLDAYRDYDLSGRSVESEMKRLEHEATILASVGAMAEAGVNVLAGTDAGNYGTIQGFSIHRELERLVQAGLNNWDALDAATSAAGDFLNRHWGVTEGDEGHVVVLAASPLEDIRATQKIVEVIQAGRVVDRRSAVADLAN